MTGRRLDMAEALRRAYGRLLPGILAAKGEPDAGDFDERLFEAGYLILDRGVRITPEGWQALHEANAAHVCPECGGYMKTAGQPRCGHCSPRRAAAHV